MTEQNLSNPEWLNDAPLAPTSAVPNEQAVDTHREANTVGVAAEVQGNLFDFSAPATVPSRGHFKTAKKEQGFDYSKLQPDLAAELQETTKRIRQAAVVTTQAVIEIGRHLLSWKEQLDHGMFTEWVECEFGSSVRTAERYMRVATLTAGKNDTLSDLSLSTLYKLSAKSTPPQVVNEVIDQAFKGKKIQEPEVKQKLKGVRRQSGTKVAAAPKLTDAPLEPTASTQQHGGAPPEDAPAEATAEKKSVSRRPAAAKARDELLFAIRHWGPYLDAEGIAAVDAEIDGLRARGKVVNSNRQQITDLHGGLA